MVPTIEFERLFHLAKARFAESMAYPLIDEPIDNLAMLNDAYNEAIDNDAVREFLETRLARTSDDVATRFVILSCYHELSRFRPDLQEGFVSHLRDQFRADLAFFVGLRRIEECNDLSDIAWEIPNACAVRAWATAQALHRRLRSLGQTDIGDFHTAFGLFLFLAALELISRIYVQQ